MDGSSPDNYLQRNIYKLRFVNRIWTRLLLQTSSAVYNIMYCVKLLFVLNGVKAIAKMPGGYMIRDQIGIKMNLAGSSGCFSMLSRLLICMCSLQ